MTNPTSNERVSDKRLAELVSHYTNVDKQHNGWWVAVYWSLRELQERRSAVETSAKQPNWPSRASIDYAIEVLDRYRRGSDPDCTCEECPQCSKSPSDCNGTECAQTCECSECDHCRVVAAIEGLRAPEEPEAPRSNSLLVLGCEECGMKPSFDGMWHKQGCSQPELTHCMPLRASGESRAEFERDRGFVRRCLKCGEQLVPYAGCPKCDVTAENGSAEPT